MAEILSKMRQVAKVGLLLLVLNGCTPATQAEPTQIVENLPPGDLEQFLASNPCTTPLLGKTIKINGRIVSANQGNVYGFQTDTQPTRNITFRDKRKKSNQIALLQANRVSAVGKFVVADNQCLFDADETEVRISPAVPDFGP